MAGRGGYTHGKRRQQAIESTEPPPEMARSFTGKCCGGPDNGKMLAHWSKVKKYYRPMVGLSMNMDGQVEAVEIGEYRLNDFGQWHWWGSEAGRAYDKLFGTDDQK